MTKTQQAKEVLDSTNDFLSELDNTLRESNDIQLKQRFENLLPDLNPELADRFVETGATEKFVPLHSENNSPSCCRVGEDGNRVCREIRDDGLFSPVTFVSFNNLDALAYQVALTGKFKARVSWASTEVYMDNFFKWEETSEKEDFFLAQLAHYRKEFD